MAGIGYMMGGRVMPPMDPLVRQAIVAGAEAHRIPPHLLMSLAHYESGYEPRALCAETKRAGLFQFAPALYRRLHVNPFEPVAAAHAAAAFLAHLRDKYRGSWVHVLAAWFWGQGPVDAIERGKTTDWPLPVRGFVQEVLQGAGMPSPVSLSLIQARGRGGAWEQAQWT